MAMLGRYRRRIATAALCALVTHPVAGPEVLRALLADVGQLVRLSSLGVQVSAPHPVEMWSRQGNSQGMQPESCKCKGACLLISMLVGGPGTSLLYIGWSNQRLHGMASLDQPVHSSTWLVLKPAME